ncbi:DNA polymerase III subunit gamma and tau [Nocardioides lianchengensis]|uniref:DNA polymerase III subunit gamma/tau n=1 Tax=Nocardioides lianchengensis TaxID=1045774 RepID=A0A1G6Q2F7_9ACTN|nr:DNA polymerase III subunit gamma and tau [Nocardioides lianchengensis]NYG12070.1 DNA polymerase-3 subunit gamma/tau [Nocardioides lianchengensis]SDC86543.1 DNA polymerase-3 subunit gamma/tau [Nocardioides lianchengensis]
MESPLALYRRYRPETFAEVIGQDHVTAPLRSALANNRVNHAYLFSGPRGCGKTTSARILARALNCEQAPVADPCGECDSCRDLARGGPGSIDVIEIDAASHGGVDDARDLREKAFFSPVRSRYKVYIIDEAHMVTTQGFNALLKLVEEPPPHLRFIFATTEPEKVLPTIRSRTHHYPFRLIPPRLLSSYLSELCEKEQVAIEPAALPLVVRAGAGSARDTLSVLDQLLGGAGPEGVTHDLATGLLGYTPDTLLDEVVDAFAAADGGAVFGVVDKVVETGQDPRRFTEDLLRRLRDLVIVAAVPEATASGLIDVSEDQGERLVAQAARFGAAELSRAADLVATGLTEMRGATAPRLLLELICARVLLPGADHSTAGVMARVDRLEKRLTITGVPSAAVAAPAPPAPPAQDRPADVSVASDRATEAAPPPTPPVESRRPVDTPAAPAAPAPAPEREPEPAPVMAPTPTAAPAPAAPVSAPAAGGLTLVEVRRLWPDIVEATKLRRRVAWMILTQNCQVVAVEGKVVTIGFSNAGARDSFVQGGCDEVFRQAAIDVVGADWKVETIVDPGTQPGSGGQPAAPAAPAPAAPTPAAQADAAPAAPAAPPDWAAEPAPEAAAPPPERAERPERPGPDAIARAREAVQQTRPAGQGEPAAPDPDAYDADADVHPDDLDADIDQLGASELLARELGARVVEEIRHQ